MSNSDKCYTSLETNHSVGNIKILKDWSFIMGCGVHQTWENKTFLDLLWGWGQQFVTRLTELLAGHGISIINSPLRRTCFLMYMQDMHISLHSYKYVYIWIHVPGGDGVGLPTILDLFWEDQRCLDPSWVGGCWGGGVKVVFGSL